MIRDIRRGLAVVGLAGAGLAVWVCTAGCSGQNGRGDNSSLTLHDSYQESASQPVISFDTLAHNFGTIVEGERVLCYFSYENSGGIPLLIQSVEASCGCTIVDWNSDPLPPGEGEQLQVVFDSSGRSGIQIKVVTVRSNASNERVELILRANVKANV
jgi:hypothetical protein